MNRNPVVLLPALLVSLLFARSIFPSRAYAGFPAQDTPATAPQASARSAQKNDVFKIGNGVSAPILIHSVEPMLSDSARDFNASVTVLVNCYVKTDGTTSSVRVVTITHNNGLAFTTVDYRNPIYRELELSSIDAVKKYKFKPAKKGGSPVMVQLNIAVVF